MNVTANHVEVKNDTCSDYFLRLAITLPPVPPNTSLDAGAPPPVEIADASIPDAGHD